MLGFSEAELLLIVAKSDPEGPTKDEWSAAERLESEFGHTPQTISNFVVRFHQKSIGAYSHERITRRMANAE